MEEKPKTIKAKNLYLNIFRVLATIAVFLYHTGMLKGGFLSVCSFFTLSGYLLYKSLTKDGFNLKKYYVNKLKRLYLPLLIVTLTSIAVISLFPELNWLNLRPESRSVLLGYNNFWQLKANADYFARHVSSPFMHFWYISILLQFDLIAPLFMMFFTKKHKENGTKLPLFASIILTILSTALFVYFFKTKDIMFVYYHTLSRVFSLLFGITLGFLLDKIKRIKKPTKLLNNLLFYSSNIALIVMYFTVSSDSKNLPIYMILSTILTLIIISSSIRLVTKEENKFTKIINYLSSITYEVYLIQYPIIYLMQDLNLDINNFTKYLIIFGGTIVLSMLLHFALDGGKKNKLIIVLRMLAGIIFVALTVYGGIVYFKTEDHTAEMKALEEELAKSNEFIQGKQEEFLKQSEEEKAAFKKMLEDLDNETVLDELVKKTPITAIGDSVMLGASQSMSAMFSNIYIDAGISRTAYVLNNQFNALEKKGGVADIIFIHMGTNGKGPDRLYHEIMKRYPDKKIYWFSVTNDNKVHVNSVLKSIVDQYDNAEFIDWKAYSSGHGNWFVSDGIHLTQYGRDAYTQLIYDTIKNKYKEDNERKKQEMIKKREEEEANRVTFIGNTVLSNSYSSLASTFTTANFITKNETTFEEITKELNELKEKELLSDRIILLFDKKNIFTDKELKTLSKTFKENKIYLVKIENKSKYTSFDNIEVIDFYKDIQKHNEYLLVDKVHLSQKGNEALLATLKKALKPKVEEQSNQTIEDKNQTLEITSKTKEAIN